MSKPVLDPVNAATLGRCWAIARLDRESCRRTACCRKRRGACTICRAACRAYLKHKMMAAGAGDLATQSLVAERSRLARFKADAAEREAKIEAGELVDVADVEIAWQAVAHAAYSRLLVIPTKIGPRIITLKSASEASALLQKELHAALNGLASTPAY